MAYVSVQEFALYAENSESKWRIAEKCIIYHNSLGKGEIERLLINKNTDNIYLEILFESRAEITKFNTNLISAYFSHIEMSSNTEEMIKNAVYIDAFRFCKRCKQKFGRIEYYSHSCAYQNPKIVSASGQNSVTLEGYPISNCKRCHRSICTIEFSRAGQYRYNISSMGHATDIHFCNARGGDAFPYAILIGSMK